MSTHSENRIAALLRQIADLETDNAHLARDLDQSRSEAAEARAALAEAEQLPYVVEYADGRPPVEYELGGAAWTDARNASYGGVEARVRHDGQLVWTVPTHGGTITNGRRSGPTLRVRF